VDASNKKIKLPIEADRITIDTNKAVSIARKFLEQYHSPVIFKSARLEEEMWKISMEVGLLRYDIIEVVINANTGKILGYHHNL
jgi:hypothetical protein